VIEDRSVAVGGNSINPGLCGQWPHKSGRFTRLGALGAALPVPSPIGQLGEPLEGSVRAEYHPVARMRMILV
jgi:hypothetical protein